MKTFQLKALGPARYLGLVVILGLLGCSPMAARLADVDRKIDRLEEDRQTALAAGDAILVERLDADLERAHAERARRRTDYQKEQETNGALYLSILAIITGGLRLAESFGKKAVLA